MHDAESCISNMNLQLHLRERLQNYGSLYGFWCYSFERCQYDTNGQSIEVQFMKKLLRQMDIQALELPMLSEGLLDISLHWLTV